MKQSLWSQRLCYREHTYLNTDIQAIHKKLVQTQDFINNSQEIRVVDHAESQAWTL